jgi:hypothetical protein
VGKGKGGYGHRLPLFIPQIALPVKLLRSIWMKIARSMQDKPSMDVGLPS